MNDKDRCVEMENIHGMLKEWLVGRCEDKAQQSMFMQDDYEVAITVE